MIAVETSSDEVHVRIPCGEIGTEALNSWLEWLRLESVTQRSNLSEAEADALAEETKATWWKSNRERFVAPQS